MASLGGEQHEKNVEEKQKTLKKSEEQSAQGTGQGLQAGDNGFLAPVLDPVGNVLQKGLAPVGATLNTVTKPVTSVVGRGVTEPVGGAVDGLMDLGHTATDGASEPGAGKKQFKEKTYGGKEQNAGNPLGL
ncbi:MAG: hypothetical protein M1821_010011 [Bathelium mastoideum]|nr:MAG: hypothetical protein M1821_010011 [Bathelium mastoideum]KAI9690218.1 MAG: hypothetical protein M1822_009179 [Bathelium mastoideum]